MQAPRSIDELDEKASAPNEAVRETVRNICGDIVVAGAGGKMGLHLCQMLRRGFDDVGSPGKVIAVSRFSDPTARKPFETAGMETISADLTQKENLERLPDAAALFFLAGIKFGTSNKPETLRLFNETMPAYVAERYSGIPTVALSTGCVYPFVALASGGSSENDTVAPGGAYAESCRGRELAFIDASYKHGTPISLIRLNYSVDLRYGVLVDLALKVRRQEPVDVGMGYFNCLWQGDAIRHTICSLAQASPAPDPFLLNVTGEKILRVRETAEKFGKRFALPVSFQGEEAETAWLSNARKSHRLYGSPEIDEDTLIDWVVDWVRNERPLLGKPTHFETRDGNY